MQTKITVTQLAELIRILYDSKNAGNRGTRERYIGDFMIKNDGLRPTLAALCNLHDHVEPVPPTPEKKVESVKAEEPVKEEEPVVEEKIYTPRRKKD